MHEQVSLGKGHYQGTIMDSLDADGIIVCATTYGEDAQASVMHCHENLHISFVLSGGSREARIGKAVERLPGNMEFYHSGEMHRTVPQCFPSKNINLELDAAFLSRTGISETQVAKAVNRNPDGKFLLLKIFKELQAKDKHAVTSINMLLLDLVNKSTSESSRRATPAWVLQVQQLMHDLWDEKLTLQDLSRASGVHYITISKHFRRYFNCTFGEYMRKLRVEKSLGFIKYSGVSLTQAAYHCQFADQSHFTRVFKSMTGFLPKEYLKL